MMRKQILSVLSAAAVLSLAAEVPKEAGVCFRYDDNQPEKKWQDMAKVFDAHKAVFCLSIISAERMTPQYIALLKDLQNRGYEIMDHTPFHSLYTYRSTAPEFRNLASFDHVHEKGGKVCYKYSLNPRFPGIPITVNLDGNTMTIVSKPKQLRDFWLRSDFFIYDQETKIAYHAAPKNGKFELTSFWCENNVKFPKKENAKVLFVNKMGGFLVPDDVLEMQASVSKKNFEKMGLKPVVTYIQPGGSEAVPDAENIAAVYEKYGYTGGATYPNSAYKAFNENNPKRQRFAMMWGSFSLERKTWDDVRTRIADRIARHQIMIASSHMQVRGVPGGWEEFLKRHDELLKWCNENKIPILTQKEWCKRLYYDKPDPKYNIMPSLAIDRDKNGRPDGWTPAKNIKVEKGIMKVSANGQVFTISTLFGCERGKNVFSFKCKAAKTCTLSIQVDSCLQTWNCLKRNNLIFKIRPGENVYTAEFEMHKNSHLLNIKCTANGITAPIELKDFSIIGK